MYYGAPVDGQILAAGDIDGDGDLDLAVSFSAMDWGDYTYSSRVKIFINNSAPPTNTDGTLTAAPGVIEPVGLPASADTVGEAVNVFDFTLRDGGGGDNVALGVSSLVVHTSGTGDFSKVTWRLSGDDVSNVIGAYSAATNTITFAGLNISVNDGGAETYTINAYYNDTAGLAEGQTYVLPSTAIRTSPPSLARACRRGRRRSPMVQVPRSSSMRCPLPPTSPRR